jgi:carbon monoxide dehydrogenase subunit G
MPTFRSSISIEAPRRDVLQYLGDAANLPAYLDGLASVVVAGSDTVRLTWSDGTSTDGWFRTEEGRHNRVEWGDDRQHGWFEVDTEGEVASVTAELHAAVADGDAVLDRTLFALKGAIEP